MTAPPAQLRLFILGETDSTSLLARRDAQAGADLPRLYVADSQTGGVGRFGRAWSSPVGGLWMTLAWPLPGGDEGLEGLGLRVGLACCDTIDAAIARAGAPGRTRLKWPNDVILHGKKVCGALCEVIPTPRGRAALLGVGINANFPATDLPESLQGRAGTVIDLLGVGLDLAALRADLVARLIGALTEPELLAATAARVRERLFGVGEPATIAAGGGQTTGVLLGLTDDGRPRLRTQSGEWAAPAGAELMMG